MYAYFIGKIAKIKSDSIVLETGNIGYNIIMPVSDIMSLTTGIEVKIYTYTAVREDAFLLYGFLDEESLDFYKLLLEVNGVGPKAAISILSHASVDDLVVAIIAQDSKTLSKLPGIGAKTAARIILDLKDKVGTDRLLDATINSTSVRVPEGKETNLIKKEACDALGALGVSASDAMKALNQLEIGADSDVADIIGEALKLI